jgi:hypothetical protein
MMKQFRMWRWPALGGFLCALTLSSCSCEEQIRQWVSNREQTRTSFDSVDAGGESTGPSEKEPNDQRSAADPIDLTQRDGPVSGAIDPVSDVDWFRLQPAEGEAWIVELSVKPAEGSELDPSVDVATSAQGTTTFNVAAPGEAESVPRLQVPKDGRLVAIRGTADSSGAYELTARRRLSGGALESEPNERPASAVSFPFPGGIQGYYDRPRDTDWLKTEGSKLTPGIYSVSLAPVSEMTHRAAFFTGADPEAVDSGEAWTTLKAGPDRSAEIPNLGVPGGLSNLWIRLQAEGELYDRESPYRLRFVEHAQPDGFVLESEPNDSDATAQSARLGDEVRGYFHHSTDTDRLSLLVGRAAQEEAEQGAKGRDVGVGAQEVAQAPNRKDAGTQQGAPAAPPKKMDEGDDSLVDMPPKMGDFQDAGTPGQDPGSETAGAPESIGDHLKQKEAPEHLAQVALKPLNDETAVQMTWLNPRDGGRRTLVSEDRDTPAILCNVPIDNGSIELAISRSDTGEGTAKRDFRTSFAYAVAFADVVGQIDNIEVEPNDSRQAADALRPETGRSGYIAYGNDTDVFGFLVPEANSPAPTPAPDAGARPDDTRRPEPRSTTVKLRANRLDLGMELVDSQGALVAEVDKAGAGANESTTLDLPPGVYFVKVSSAGGQACRPYEISVDVAGQ